MQKIKFVLLHFLHLLRNTVVLALFHRSHFIGVSLSFQLSFHLRSDLHSIGLKVTGAIDLV
jgi:hypothetical protein